MPDEEPKSDELSAIWDARSEALSALFGPTADDVWHSDIPFEVGGPADALMFPNWIPGEAYITAELTGKNVGQIPNSLGNYELMMCAKQRNHKMAAFISRIAPYTCQTQLDVGHTMNLKGFFGDSMLQAVLYTHPTDHPVHFELLGQRYGILMAIGITGDEFEFLNETSHEELLPHIIAGGIFPYTVPGRPSVPLPKKKSFFGRLFSK